MSERPTATDSPILIVDDDRELCALLVEFLAGEDEEATCVHDGPSGLRAALSGRHALVVLDVMLPGLSGFELLQELRPRSAIPVIMLTARGEDGDKITGLEAGADDYLSKPFNPRELLARIRAVLRRAPAMTGEGLAAAGAHPPEGLARLRRGDLELDVAARSALRGGQRLPLTGVELELLHVLLVEVGRVVSRDELSETALGRPFDPRDRAIDIHISSLRRKLHAPGDQESPIKTVRGEGYVLTPAPAAGATRRG